VIPHELVRQVGYEEVPDEAAEGADAEEPSHDVRDQRALLESVCTQWSGVPLPVEQK